MADRELAFILGRMADLQELDLVSRQMKVAGSLKSDAEKKVDPAGMEFYGKRLTFLRQRNEELRSGLWTDWPKLP